MTSSELKQLEKLKEIIERRVGPNLKYATLNKFLADLKTLKRAGVKEYDNLDIKFCIDHCTDKLHVYTKTRPVKINSASLF